MTDVAIIGCGPAGLLAAHAVEQAGGHPVIYSKQASPSPTARGVFLHRAIPELTREQHDAMISIVGLGSSRGYANKVYGDPDAPTSFNTYTNRYVEGWALAPVYQALWDRYGERVVEVEISATGARQLVELYDIVINTAPASALCQLPGRHAFPRRRIWVRPGCPAGMTEQTVLYNGDPAFPWYRSHRLFGVEATEYSWWQATAREGMKVMPTTCDCQPKIVRAGRWGRWEPGVLLHHAYEEAQRALQ